MELAVAEIQDPVVAPSVEPPDRLSVGEDQQLASIGRPGVLLDSERNAVSLRNELPGGDQYLPRPVS
jgi:hypothetical protein